MRPRPRSIPGRSTRSTGGARQAVDLDLDGLPDLLGLPASTHKPGEIVLPSWARNEGSRFAAETLSLKLPVPGVDGHLAVDLVGDALPDILVVAPGEAPSISRNLGNGQHWLALELGGHWRVKPELMRTNSHAIGTRMLARRAGAARDVSTIRRPRPDWRSRSRRSSRAWASTTRPTLVHLRWPDGVMQCELNVPADQKLTLAENNRKTGSCPVLFTWNGERFVCIGDFLGGGGLGYLVAPGVYSQPDRDEAIAVTAEQLQASRRRLPALGHRADGRGCLPRSADSRRGRPPPRRFVNARRTVCARRPQADRERWWPGEPPSSPFTPPTSTGRDMTETFATGIAAPSTRSASAMAGSATPKNTGSSSTSATGSAAFGPSDPLVLCLAGWVEYPYSQTNYAAATAGVTLNPPAIETAT